jgi:hypothetical protein
MLDKVYRFTLLLTALVLVSFVTTSVLTSCAAFQTAKEQPFSTWSSKKKMTWAIDTYKAEYDKYFVAAVRPDLTEGQKAYLVQKRKALVALDKTIAVMIPIVDAGGEIPINLETQLLTIMGELGYQPM